VANLTGEFLAGGTAGLEAPAPVASSEHLWAEPSIMRTRTEIRSDGRLETPAVLVLYDAAGRTIRSLIVPPGEVRSKWDGRDMAGRSAPSGVYFARLIDGTGTLSARIVKLR
jgi:hypothetical protein